MQQLIFRDTDRNIEVPIQIEFIQPYHLEGDLLLVKFGDPVTGWIPEPEHVEAVKKFFEEHYKGAAKAFYYNYGIRIDRMVIPDQPVVLLVGLGQPGMDPPDDAHMQTVESELKELLRDHPNVKVRVIPYTSALFTPQREGD
jgi:hypothetical protein